MARKKISGIVKVGDRNFKIDKIVVVNDKRIHVRASGYASAQEAKDALPGIIEAKRREMNPTTTSKTFEDLLDQYEAFRSAKAKPQTLEAIHYLFTKHITPSFSGLTIPEALTVDRVRQWYLSKASSTSDSAQRKNKVFGEMRQLVDRAWHWHYITSETHQDLEDIIQSVKLPSRAKSSGDVWTYADEQKFLASIPKDSIDYPMFTLFCYLGCRLGEFLGLQWRSFDDEKGLIAIDQQVIHKNGKAVLTSELKTNESYRVNQLDQETLSLLRKYRSTLDSSAEGEFIFPSPYSPSMPLSRTEFRRRFNRYIELSGVPKIVPHGVRHSKATMIAGVCRNAEEVAVGAKFLGHSSSMFMGTYVSSQGIDQSDIINRLKANR